ncbi:MAG: glycine cleavage system aminomethyltransferase GcvT, partial [Candidatus Aminicenantales bacterium]
MKQTRFNAQHRKLGARMIEFCGWDMPVEYKGLIEEHLACRKAAGLFDVSHMGEIHVTGKDALAFVQHVSPNDAARLSPGQVQYTGLLNAKGTYVDDMLVYCVHPEFYLLVVNAANTDKDFAYVVSQKGGFAVQLDNASDRYSQLALQGRQAIPILQPLTDVSLAPMHSFT